MKTSPALWIYRTAWEPVLWFASILAGLEELMRLSLSPSRWKLAERLGWRWKGAEGKPALWMHAASLGECKGLWALAESLQSLPVSFVLTANTTTGLEYLSQQIESLQKNGAGQNRWRAMLAPCDHPRIVRKFLRHFQIDALLLYEVELWPHFILTSRREKKPVYWVSARLTPKARRRCAAFPKTAGVLLNSLSWIQTQAPEEAEILRGRGCESLDVGVDLKGLCYLPASRAKMEPGTKTMDWNHRRGIAFVSLHAAELPFVLSAITAAKTAAKSLQAGTPIFIFPREMKELSRFEKLLKPLGFALHSQAPDHPLLIVDSFGLIPQFLEDCHAAVIGGSFAGKSYSGHNLWEPLAAGVFITIGPDYLKQAYLVARLQKTGLLHISKSTLSPEFLQKPATDPGSLCKDFIETESYILQQAASEIENQIRKLPGNIRKTPAHLVT